MIRVYLAGPDVFYHGHESNILHIKSNILNRAGFISLTPFDNEIKITTPRRAALIRENNLRLITECDIILANLTPYPQLTADTGTVYEIGYAIALKKRFYGYTNNSRLFYNRVYSVVNKAEFSVENFDLVDNLMYASYDNIVVPEHDVEFNDLTTFNSAVQMMCRNERRKVVD